jgi:hypothetical protein
MLFISHRGNLTGANTLLENHPTYIQHALEEGVDVEVDIWFIDGQFHLGHDNPQTRLPEHFLADERIWFHCKNVEALYAIEKREFFQGSHLLNTSGIRKMMWPLLLTKRFGHIRVSYWYPVLLQYYQKLPVRVTFGVVMLFVPMKFIKYRDMYKKRITV